MALPPVLTSYWDHRRKALSYKIEIPGTRKYLLFTDETLADLANQIEAMKASRGTVRT
jgi:hypothetical protein